MMGEIFVDMGNGSCMNEDSGKMVLRCKKYPKKGSKEWLVSGDSIESRVMEREEKNRTFLISDITKARLWTYLTASALQVQLKVDGRTVFIPLITSEDVDAVREVYDYLSKENPNISPLPPVIPPEPIEASEGKPAKPELLQGFVIRARRRTVARDLVIGLLLLSLALPIALAADINSSNFISGVGLSLLGAIFTYHGIYLRFWKCTIEGNTISYQSLFRRKTITFFDIRGVTPKYLANVNRRLGTATGGFVGIDLYSEGGKLFHIHGAKIGFRALVARLEERNIPGVEKLPQGILWR